MNTSKPKGEDNRRVPMGKVPLSERLALSPEEAASTGPYGLTKINAAIKNGALKAKKNGRCKVILVDDFKAWLLTLPDASSEGVAA